MKTLLLRGTVPRSDHKTRLYDGALMHRFMQNRTCSYAQQKISHRNAMHDVKEKKRNEGNGKEAAAQGFSE